MKSKRFKIILGVCLVLFVAAMALAAEPYNLGVDLAITGTGALYCKDGVDAISLARSPHSAQPIPADPLQRCRPCVSCRYPRG